MAFSAAKTKRSDSVDTMQALVPSRGFYQPTSIRQSVRYKHVRGLDDSNGDLALSTRKQRARMYDLTYQNKCRDLDRERRRFFHEQSLLLKELSSKKSELQKTTSKLQALMQTKTQLQSNIATLEKELKELRKTNDILKIKNATLENTGLKKNKIHVELANARGNLVAKEHDLAELKLEIASLKIELAKVSKTHVEEVESTLKSLQSKMDEVDRENTEIRIYAAEIAGSRESQLDSDQIQTEQEIYEKHCRELESELEKDGEQYIGAGGCSESPQGYRDTLVDRVSLLKDHNYELEEQCDKYLKTISALESQVNSLRAQLSELNNDLYKTTTENDNLLEHLDLTTAAQCKLDEDKQLLLDKCVLLEDELAELQKTKNQMEVTHQEENRQHSSIAEANAVELETVKQHNEDLIKENEETQDRIDQLLKAVTSLEEEIDLKKRTVAVKDEFIQDLEEQISEEKANLEKKCCDLAKLQKEMDSNNQYLDEIQWQLREATENYTNLEEKVCSIEIVMNERQELLNTANANCDEMSRKLNCNEEKIALLEESIRVHETIVRDMDATLAAKGEKINEFEERLTNKEELLNDIHSKLRDAENDLVEKHSVLERVSVKIQELEKVALGKEDEIAAFKSAQKLLECQCSATEKQLQAVIQEKEEVVHQLLTAEEKLNQTLHELEGEKQSLSNARDNNVLLEEQVAELKKIIEENEQHIAKLGEHKQDILNVQQMFTSRILELEYRLTEKDALNLELQRELEEMQELCNNLNARTKQLEHRLVDKEEQIQHGKTLKIELEKMLESSSQQQKCITDQKQEIIESRETINWLKTELDRCRANIEWFDHKKDAWLQELSAAEEKASNEEEEKLKWQRLYEELYAKVEPFQEQLEMFEVERRALLSQNSEAHEEVAKVGKQYALLLGHQNQKQKIHHIIKLKEENIQLKTESQKHKEHVLKLKTDNQRLKDQLNGMLGRRKFDPSKAFTHINKENSTPLQDTN